MENTYVEKLYRQIEKTLKISSKQIQAVLKLLEEGSTVPFIARYRKEMTGSLDEEQIREISKAYEYGVNLQQRKEDVTRLIDEKGMLTPELKTQIETAQKLTEIEDIYRPYKEKKKTRATTAKAKGLEPLAKYLLTFPKENVEQEAEKYITEEVATAKDALQGAKDIIAEMISDNANYRKWIRQTTFRKAMLTTAVKDDEKDEKRIFEMYYQYEEPVSRIVPHRILAINRGEKEGIIRAGIKPPIEDITRFLEKGVLKKPSIHIKEAIEDGYKRLIQPSIEREIRSDLTEKAEQQAIHIFSENLRNLLLQPPMKRKRVLGVDPAYRTGCKLAVVDDTGKMLKIDVIYPHPPKPKKAEAKEKVKNISQEFEIEMIAIGNGTASRETEQFIADILKEVGQERDISYMIVNEAGASVYSASDLAREEFPKLQVEERSAVSIARRLQDPLAELVKIDPKSVGVGQYQHDVSQKSLQDSLHFVVETAVNQVGVNVNTASSSLLQYVSGLSKTVAGNIVKKREEEGKFVSRSQLKAIHRLGAKTYEQCVGFLRILEGENPLDRTPIHPENYSAVKKLIQLVNLNITDIGTDEMKEKLQSLSVPETAEKLGVGEITLIDIIDALIRPERDLRDDLPQPLLRKDVLQMEDLKKGMELEGTVRNVVDFGAFVDIGVKQDGLVHKSKLSGKFVKHPLDVVSVGQIVKVWIEDVDLNKGRVALTMVAPTE